MKITKISHFSAMPVFKGNLKNNISKDCCPPRKVVANLERTLSRDVFKKI